MKNISGFSLVELMVAVGIVGIMSSVAVPKYQKFKAGAKQAEAKSTLSSIFTLQQLYFTEEDKYTATLTDTGFTDPPATSAYSYTAGLGPSSDDRVFKAMATARKKLGSCVTNSTDDIDMWCVNQDKVMSNIDSVANHAPCVAADTNAAGC